MTQQRNSIGALPEGIAPARPECFVLSDEARRCWSDHHVTRRVLLSSRAPTPVQAVLSVQRASTNVAPPDGAVVTASSSFGTSGCRSASRLLLARNTTTAIENAAR